jgi:hypothetical protein
MVFRRALILGAASLALTGASFAIPAAANAALSGCSVSKSSPIAVTGYCKTITTPSLYRAWAECFKGGSHPQYAISTGPWRTPIDHTPSVAKCAAGFVVTSNYGMDLVNP